VRISDLAGGADVHTTHARITMLDVGPCVIGNVKEGIIDYSGHHGSVKLFAGWELNLNLTSQSFAGEMTATAEGPVRVLIPRGFTTAFEANITKTAAFVCRADIRSQISYSESLGRAIYTFGQGTPTIRLRSLRGPIVIDNHPGECDEVDANAVLR
jgi:hypothetical protein